MNGKKAKMLRKMAYADQSLKGERKYDILGTFKTLITGRTDKEGNPEKRKVTKLTAKAVGLRRVYKDAKRTYSKGKSDV